MALLPTVYEDSRDWVITVSGVRPYPKAAKELLELAESRGWWTLDGLPVRVASDGLHRIRVEIGRRPSGGRNGYRYMALWTSDVGDHGQFAVAKIMAMSTEWDGWIQISGISDVRAKIEHWPAKPAPVLRESPGTGATH